MKYLDEYRDERIAQKIVDEIRRTRDAAVGDDGSLRRADALHREVRPRLAAARRRSNWCTGRAVRSA